MFLSYILVTSLCFYKLYKIILILQMQKYILKTMNLEISEFSIQLIYNDWLNKKGQVYTNKNLQKLLY